MPKIGRIDSHPQRAKIIDAMLAGESSYMIAKWVRPSLDQSTIWRYWKSTVQPALQRNETSATIMQQQDSVSRLTQKADPDAAIAIKQAVLDGPVLAVRDKRIGALQDRWDRLQVVMTERAADMAGAPGGRSGLLVRQSRQLGEQIIEEYKLDTGLLGEFRAHEKQVAQELGQWSEGEGGSQAPQSIAVSILLGLPRGGPVRPEPVDAAVEVLAIEQGEGKP